MNKRVIFVGLIFGIVLSLLLIYPLRIYLPGQFVEGLPSGHAGLASALIILCVLIVMLTGFLAVKVSRASNGLEAASVGAVAGLIATLLAEMALGGAAAGTWAARDILNHGIHITQDDAELYGLLSNAVASTLWWSYASTWLAASFSLILGLIGGLIAGSKRPSGKVDDIYWITISSVGVFGTTITSFLAGIVLHMLVPATEQSAAEVNVKLTISIQLLVLAHILTTSLSIAFWQCLGWFALRRYSPTTVRRHRFTLLAVLLNGFLPLGLILLYLTAELFRSLWVLLFLIPFSLSLFTLRQAWILYKKGRPGVLASPLNLSNVVETFAISGGILLLTSYMGCGVFAFNIIMLIVPMVPVLALHDLSMVDIEQQFIFDSIPEMVAENFFVHILYLLTGLLMILVGTGLLTVLIRIGQHFAMKDTPEKTDGDKG